MFYRLGHQMAARARVVVSLALVVLALSAVLGVGVFGRLLTGGFDDPASASSQAKELLDRDFGGEPNIVFLVQARSGTVDDPAVEASGRQLDTRLEQDDRLSGVTSYWDSDAPALRSRDGSGALILATVQGDESAAASSATDIVEEYGDVDDAAVTVRIGGQLGTDIGGQVSKDLAVAESIAVPITLLLLVVAFGSMVAALLPLGVALFAVFGTFAELSLLTHVTSVSVFAINLTTALGLGLGIDYALLMVSRFREELAHGVPVEEAVARTTATAGRTIAFSALTVIAALAAMLVFPVYFLKSFAYAGVGVTVLAALTALIVLPAVLSILGPRVNAGRVPGMRSTRSIEAPLWGRLAAAVMRRPVLAAAPVVAVLLIMAAPLLSVTFGTPDDRVLPSTAASHRVGDAIRNDFATAPDNIDVLLTPAVAASELRSYARKLSLLDGVQRVDSAAGSFAHGAAKRLVVDAQALSTIRADRLTLSTGLDAASTSAEDLVQQVREVDAPTGTTPLVGGTTATLTDAKQAISSRLWLAGALIAATTFLLLFLFTGSVVQPLRALVGNALTLGATIGAMVWIFEDGHLSSYLGFTPTPTNTAMPVLLFCIAFGLSMDYEVFLMSRIKELHDAGAPTREAVVHGLARTGRIVSTAAALLAVSFFAFGTSRVSFIQFFGLGTGLAILVDATLVRGILVPASMRLFGEHSWYAPSVLRRVHGRVGLSEPQQPAAFARVDA